MPSLKTMIDKNTRSNVVYKLECSGCHASYVGLTSRHLITRVLEHFHPDGVMTKHEKECKVKLDPKQCSKILNETHRDIVYLSILEALHIREIKPKLNTKDEYIGRLLRIRY